VNKTRTKAPDETVVEVPARRDLAARLTRDVFSPRNPDLACLLRRREPDARQRAFFLVDAGVAAARPDVCAAIEGYARAHSATLVLAGAPLIVEGGELCKARREVCDWIRARLTGAGIDARSHVVIVGGGSLLDAAGFAAATLHGGVRVTRVPTTLAAQVGAAWSSDCAVHACGRRDWMRAVQTPFAVALDPRWLASLPLEERRAGLAEAMRLALVCEPRLFHWICDRAQALAAFERRSIEALTRWCARLQCERLGAGEARAAIGGRAAGFGRWAEYGLRALAPETDGSVAAAVGVAVDVLLSVVLTGLPPETAKAALETLAALGLPLWHEALGESDEEARPALLAGLAELRDREGGAPSIPLLQALGRPALSECVSAEAVAAVLEALYRWSGLEP